MPESQAIIIRPAQSIADYLGCQRVQRLSWGIDDASYLVPIATMVGAQLHGGLVLGAFLPGGEAVGMSFAFLGKVGERLCLYSQLTGIAPGHQGQGIGYLLKSAQRKFALREQIPCIAWAFDPLQAGNARFNLDRLGAAAIHYHINMYGARSDALNRDTPTDRLIAVWETSERQRERATSGTWIIAVSSGVPIGMALPDAPDPLLLEIPEDINRLRREQPEVAQQWGQVVREAFMTAFARGYRATGFVRRDRSAYRLVRGDS